ncbi:MAG: hypothetical protein ACK4IA_11930 [Paracoccus hibiscisoli]|uniref:hypothetical protein n=1 Tax=Paracoccus hibiscisoli TaxID=2023261 RepID=UPI003918A490
MPRHPFIKASFPDPDLTPRKIAKRLTLHVKAAAPPCRHQGRPINVKSAKPTTSYDRHTRAR